MIRAADALSGKLIRYRAKDETGKRGPVGSQSRPPEAVADVDAASRAVAPSKRGGDMKPEDKSGILTPWGRRALLVIGLLIGLAILIALALTDTAGAESPDTWDKSSVTLGGDGWQLTSAPGWPLRIGR
jgi:hypothetical protein